MQPVSTAAPEINLRLVTDVEVEGIDTRDYPDFSDAFISYAAYDGQPMTEQQLDQLNQCSDFVYEQILKRIF